VDGDATSPPQDGQGGLLSQISNEMVRLYKEQFGRGPRSARTEWAGPDTLLCTLEQTFTPAERSLAEMGEDQRLRDTRLFFQHATEREFRDVVERLTGRAVRAFVSGLDAQHDIATEVFYLASSDGADATGRAG
jgi:uncharacterized protein YbcI